jgi:hypothetical protein
MEKIKAEKSVFHKQCFRCKECNKQLKWVITTCPQIGLNVSDLSVLLIALTTIPHMRANSIVCLTSSSYSNRRLNLIPKTKQKVSQSLLHPHNWRQSCVWFTFDWNADHNWFDDFLRSKLTPNFNAIVCNESLSCLISSAKIQIQVQTHCYLLLYNILLITGMRNSFLLINHQFYVIH